MKKSNALIIDRSGYKVGLNEIDGLEAILRKSVEPIIEFVADKAYWTKPEFDTSEYKSRDGFIPYSHNCGGLELTIIVPSFESYSWGFLGFGECDECDGESQCGYHGQECASESGGHLDAKFRVWLKFEGLDDDGTLRFYLYCGGGNGDAPYFRTKAERTLFETEFSSKTLAGAERNAKRAVKSLLSLLKRSA